MLKPFVANNPAHWRDRKRACLFDHREGWRARNDQQSGAAHQKLTMIFLKRVSMFHVRAQAFGIMTASPG